MLATGDGFASTERGFQRAATAVAARGLDAELPRRGEGQLHLRLAGGAEVRVRERGAEGEGAIADRAVSYRRAGGTTFWTAAPGGVEEWIHLEAGAAAGEGPVAAWEIEGAELRQRGERVDLVDAAGVTLLEVTAPVAYAEGGLRIGVYLAARGSTIELRVDATDGEVLVDPVWSTVAALSSPRVGHTAALLPSGKVLVAGGFDGNSYLASTTIYDPATNSWTAGPSFSAPRGDQSSTVLASGKVLIAGGGNQGATQYLPGAELFDPSTTTWSAAGSIPARRYHTATLLADGRVLVAGGSNGSATNLASAYLYDPSTNAWTAGASMVYARNGHRASRLADGRVLVTGGAYGANVIPEIYDPIADTWTAASSMSRARWSHVQQTLGNGKVLVAGGGVFDNSAELYDPATNSWSTTGSMNAVRTQSTVATLNDGTVFVAAGSGHSSPLPNTDIYNPTSGTWTAGPPLDSARAWHTMTLLSGGDVLITGGQNNIYPGYLSSVELLTTQAPSGAQCAANSACASGYCVDGVCCNSACAGGTSDCQACSVAAGAAQNGVCGAVTGVSGCTPTCITLQRGVSGAVVDSSIDSAQTTKNYGAATAIAVGLVGAGQRQGLLRFDLSSIPAGSVIDSATLTLMLTGSNTLPLRAHQITAAWSESAVTWSSLNGAFLAQVDASLAGSGSTLSTSVTSLVQAWVNTPASNNGLLLERDLTAAAPSCFSSDYATVASRPKLSVCYTH